MKQYNHFFGVDVSEKTIDVTLSKNAELVHRQFSNDGEGMDGLMQGFRELAISSEDTLFCMEATGVYWLCTNAVFSQPWH